MTASPAFGILLIVYYVAMVLHCRAKAGLPASVYGFCLCKVQEVPCFIIILVNAFHFRLGTVKN